MARHRGIARGVRRRRLGLAMFRIRHARLSWRAWLRYARFPRVAPMAGTPLAADGSVLVSRALARKESGR